MVDFIVDCLLYILFLSLIQDGEILLPTCLLLTQVLLVSSCRRRRQVNLGVIAVKLIQEMDFLAIVRCGDFEGGQLTRMKKVGFRAQKFKSIPDNLMAFASASLN